MQKLKKKDSNDSKCATTLENILLLGTLLQSCSFHFVNNESNSLAQKVAQFGVDLKNVVMRSHLSWGSDTLYIYTIINTNMLHFDQKKS